MNLPSIASHARSHNIVPNKSLGQNFIFDESLCDKIVREAGLSDFQNVLEVGPGPGGLTRSLLKTKPKRLVVIEKDRRCLDLLNEIKSYYPNLEILEGDALRVKLSDISKDKITIVANLPYNIGTELIFRWLDEVELVNSISVMLQKEVVERICANPGSKKYGKLSIMCQILCDVDKLFDVSRESFNPPPKVTSAIVHLTPKNDLPSKEILINMRRIAQLAFSARRKMLKSSLKSISGDIVEFLQKANINPALRAEDLSVDDYKRLASLMPNIG